MGCERRPNLPCHPVAGNGCRLLNTSCEAPDTYALHVCAELLTGDDSLRGRDANASANFGARVQQNLMVTRAAH